MGQKELKKVIRELKRQGFKVEGKKGHIKLRAPWGQLFVCSGSPRCPHAHKHLLKDIEKYGGVQWLNLLQK